MEEVESISVNIEVKVTKEEDKATVVIPPEIRLTERLVNFLNSAVKARNLKLTHWTISLPEHKTELENLPNVVMEPDETL